MVGKITTEVLILPTLNLLRYGLPAAMAVVTMISIRRVAVGGPNVGHRVGRPVVNWRGRDHDGGCRSADRYERRQDDHNGRGRRNYDRGHGKREPDVDAE